VKKPALLSLFLLLIVQFRGQNKMLDSLWASYKKPGQADTSRLKTMGLITHNYAFVDADTGRILSLAMIREARKLKIAKAEMVGYNSLGVNLMYMDSSQAALDVFATGYKLADKAGDKGKMASALMNMGLVYTNLSDHQKGLEYKLKALKLRQEIGDKKGMGNAYANLGISYTSLNDNPKAIDAYLKSLKIAEELGDRNLMANNMNNIGIIYRGMNDPDKAIVYFEKSGAIKKEVGNKRSLANTYTNLGDSYYDKGDFKRSMEFYQKGFDLQKELGNRRGIANSLSTLAAYYQNLPDSEYAKMNMTRKQGLSKALDCSQQALKLNEEIGDKNAICVDLNNIASAYIDMGQVARAEQIMNRVLVLAEETGQLSRERDALLTLSEIYERMGNTGKALKAYKRSVLLRDSLQSEDKHDEITRLQVQYEYNKKAHEDSVKNAAAQEVKDAEIVAQQAQLKQEKTQRFALYGGLLLLFGFGIFAYNRFRMAQKQKRIIEEQKHLVEEKQKEILDSIHYAKRIQSSLMPHEKYIEKHLVRLKKDA